MPTHGTCLGRGMFEVFFLGWGGGGGEGGGAVVAVLGI